MFWQWLCKKYHKIYLFPQYCQLSFQVKSGWLNSNKFCMSVLICRWIWWMKQHCLNFSCSPTLCSFYWSLFLEIVRYKTRWWDKQSWQERWVLFTHLNLNLQNDIEVDALDYTAQQKHIQGARTFQYCRYLVDTWE